MATESILPMYHKPVSNQEKVGQEADLSAFLSQEPSLQDDAFLQELLATQGDDLLASLLDPSVSVIGAPMNFDLDTQNHSYSPPTDNNGYHSDTSHANQANSPGSLASMSDQLSSPSHSPLVSSTLPDLQPLVGMETTFGIGAYEEELGMSNAMMTTIDGSSTSSSPPPPPDVCIDVDLRLSSPPIPSPPDHTTSDYYPSSSRKPSSSSSSSSSTDRKAATLVLTEEEKRLLSEEGIALPTDMPLTKDEQKHLKRVQRKIKNKISAQESRKRKKDYVGGLEGRVKICTDRNRELKREVDCLKSENRSLLSQLKKLQAMVTQYQSPSRLQTGTVLMVLVLSFSFFVVPQLKSVDKNSLRYGVNYEFRGGFARPSRSLLFAETDEFGNVIDTDTGYIISHAGGQSPTPLPPWIHQTPAVFSHIDNKSNVNDLDSSLTKGFPPSLQDTEHNSIERDEI